MNAWKKTLPTASSLFSTDDGPVKKLTRLDDDGPRLSLPPFPVAIKTDSEPKQPTAPATGNYDDDDDAMDVDSTAAAVEKKEESAPDEVDPLDAFMNSISSEVKDLTNKAIMKAKKEAGEKADLSIMDDFDEEPTGTAKDKEAEEKEKRNAQRRRVLDGIDHSKIEYAAFNKDFYQPVPELAKLTDAEVAVLREELDDIRIRGKDCPAPIKFFAQCGFNKKIMSALEKNEYVKPTPIQAQALPAVMSGRDIIGIAKTGSGKTLAFLLPMFRHILAQPPLSPSDGPIALIMAPTRELAYQIHKDIKKFEKATGIRSVCVYGGAGVQSQIGDLKRGTEVVVCTPGRMIDVLTSNKGRVTNLKRVTYLVLDEADRMFDMGFEPQITKIIQNIRPDRQVVLFSATFPRAVEAVVRKILKNPLEISVRGKGIVADTIDQRVEILTTDRKLPTLLKLISDWYEKGSVLVFVDRQEDSDTLWHEILRSGYQALSLHGGKDQIERDETLKEFKNGGCKILVATSVAARGLDVPSIRLVVNYDVPNHLEDYVHRVGRTGRAGNTGTAYTFITPDEEQYARDVKEALVSSGKEVPEDLKKMVDAFEEKRKAGMAKKHKSGFAGSGFKFDDEEARRKAERIKAQKIALGLADEEEEEYHSDNEEEDPNLVTVITNPEALAARAAKEQMESLSNITETTVNAEELQKTRDMIERAGPTVAADAIKQILGTTETKQVTSLEEGRKLAMELLLQAQEKAVDTKRKDIPMYQEELEINDYPQSVRWKVTNKENATELMETTQSNIYVRGVYVQPGRNPPAGQRKLFIIIEATSPEEARAARTEVKRVLDELALTARDVTPSYGRYNVI